MQYAYTIFYVKDVQETLAFYEGAFGFTTKFITPENDYAELISGETTIAFASIALGHSNIKDGFTESAHSNKPFGMEMAFTTDDIEGDYKRALEAGATEVQSIAEKPWGQKVGYVRDLNGFLIAICTPMKS